ncbi:MAG: serine hydrolase [Betaproteobacteria bacterium]|nr:serine hydrolase [Betaproteobacteria bacterium]
MPARFALAALVALAGAGARAQALPDPFPQAAAAYLVLEDGAPLWGRAADERRAPASLAKLMSALVVLEDGQFDVLVVVSAKAAAARGARLGLRAGERWPAHALFAAMLVGSANDACAALAERNGGAAAFVARMNEKAPLLGMRNTRFAGPCGFDADRQHSTARDLARLATVAMRRAQIAALVGRPEIEVASADRARVIRVKNTNALIGNFPGVVGVKTGQTRRAGHNLIALAERDGRRVLLVMLGARDRWWGAHQILARAHAR